MDNKHGAHIDISKQKRWTHIIQATLMLFIVIGVFARYWQNITNASIMTNRSVTVSTPITTAVSSHVYTYTLAGGTNVASIKFEYCSNSPVYGIPCTPPQDMSADSAILTSQTGETGFSINSAATNLNTIVINRASPAVTVAGQSSYKFDNIINPSGTSKTIFVRISAHDTLDATGPATDQGSVAFSITNSISIGAFVPPYIAFCVGQTLGSKCSSATGFDLSMGSLSESTSALQTTQLSGATNAVGGYTVYVIGYTLTAGTSVIPAMSTAAASTIGTSQFGINARANSNPSVGQEPSSGGTLAPIGDYAVPNQFKYNSGDAIAQSITATDFNTITVSYVANTSATQAPGVYTTTLTYVATSTF